MSTRKILLCGHGGCGKDFIAEVISKLSVLNYKHGTSWYAKESCHAAAVKRHNEFGWGGIQEGITVNISDLSSPTSWWFARRGFRKFWYDHIKQVINKDDPSALYRLCYKDGNDIITGTRTTGEFFSAKVICQKTLTVWVNAVNKQIDVDPTQDFGSEACDITINNDFTNTLDTIIRVRDVLAFMGFSERNKSWHPNQEPARLLMSSMPESMSISSSAGQWTGK